MSLDKSILGLVLLAIVVSGNVGAEQVIGPMAKEAARLSGADQAPNTEEKLLRALTLVNVMQYPRKKAPPMKQGEPPPIPAGGTHPYEWDSLRTAEKILGDQDGGSCGSYGLSLAAILRAAGVPSNDIRLVGSVYPSHYAEICPEKGGAPRVKQWEFPDGKGGKEKVGAHPANGHVFLQVKWGNRWRLVNTTHDPLSQPLSKKSAAWVRYAELMRQCTKGDSACYAKARLDASSLLTLDDFETLPFAAPETIDLSGSQPPVFIDSSRFPSFARALPQSGQSGPPPMLIFQSWRFEDYPVHDIQGRSNLVASGSVDGETCRWSAADVLRGSASTTRSEQRTTH